MKHTAIIVLFATILAHAALAQDSAITDAEETVLTDIAQCMFAGLPQNWGRAEMIVELLEPGSTDAAVIYRMTPILSGTAEPFLPCDGRKPAEALLRMRESQSAERAGWKTARFVLRRDGKFDLKYDYPKKN
jgi:hypothetical protein